MIKYSQIYSQRSGFPISIDSTFYTTIDGFVNGGTRHPYFGMPKAEWIFKELLEEYNITYEFQKSFKDLKNQATLFFDYYLLVNIL